MTSANATPRRYINLPAPPGKPPYSDAVLVGDTLYIAGRIGFDATGRVPDDPRAEARILLDWVRAVLAEAGMSMQELVFVQIFCPQLSLFEPFNAIYREYFQGELPARAFIDSGPLLRGGRFQFMGTAQRSHRV